MPSPIGLRSTSVAAVLGLAMLGWSVAKAPAAAARGFKQVNLVADTTYAIGTRLRGIQTGALRNYVLFLVVAAVGIFLVLSWVFVATAAGR